MASPHASALKVAGEIGMTRRKAILAMLGLLVGVPIGFVVILYLTAPRHRITWDSHEKIQKGMTLDEVEAILGVPPGDYGPAKPRDFHILPDFTRYKFIRDRLSNASEIGPAETPIETWSATDIAITVVFEDDNAASVWTGFVLREKAGFLDKLCGWLRLPWW